MIWPQLHGNHTGPMSDSSLPAVDEWDAYSKEHDKAYEKYGFRSYFTWIPADQVYLDQIRWIDRSKLSAIENDKLDAAILYFTLKKKYGLRPNKGEMLGRYYIGSKMPILGEVSDMIEIAKSLYPKMYYKFRDKVPWLEAVTETGNFRKRKFDWFPLSEEEKEDVTYDLDKRFKVGEENSSLGISSGVSEGSSMSIDHDFDTYYYSNRKKMKIYNLDVRSYSSLIKVL